MLLESVLAFIQCGAEDRSAFQYQHETDSFLCPEAKILKRYALSRKDRAVYYQAEAKDCGNCSLKSGCTKAPRRLVTRHLYDDVLNRMQQRTTPDKMRLRRITVEHPFATLKYQIFGHPRFLLRGLSGSNHRKKPPQHKIPAEQKAPPRGSAFVNMP